MLWFISTTEKDATMRHTTGEKKEDEKHKEKNTEKNQQRILALVCSFVYEICIYRVRCSSVAVVLAISISHCIRWFLCIRHSSIVPVSK